ncbi:MAG: hypothetical protein ACJ75B_07260 [Flavisolibacter sp.]
MKLLSLFLFSPLFSCCQLSVSDILQAYSKRTVPDSALAYVMDRGYRMEYFRIDSFGLKRASYVKDGTAIAFCGSSGLTMMDYRTFDKKEFVRWHREIIALGYTFEKKYSGEGKRYKKYVQGQDIFVAYEGVEDGRNIFCLVVL